MANLYLNSFKVKILGWYLKCRWSVGNFLFFLLDCEESLLLLDSVVWSDFSELVLLWDPIPIQSLSEVDWGVEPCLEFFIRANCSEKLLNIEANCSNTIAGDGVEFVGGGVEVCIEEYVRVKLPNLCSCADLRVRAINGVHCPRPKRAVSLPAYAGIKTAFYYLLKDKY